MKEAVSAASTRLFSTILTVTFLLCAMSAFAQQPSIEGTYQLIGRKLPDGTNIAPPNVMGLLSLSRGYRNLNVLWKDANGKWSSYSIAATYRLTATQYSETILFNIFYDASSGQGVAYSTTGETKLVPIKTEGGRVLFTLPWNEPSVVFDGNKLTATIEGAFIDFWEKVE